MRGTLAALAFCAVVAGTTPARADTVYSFQSSNPFAWSQDTIAAPQGFDLAIDTELGDMLALNGTPTQGSLQASVDGFNAPSLALTTGAGSFTASLLTLGNVELASPMQTTLDFSSTWRVTSSSVQGIAAGTGLTLTTHVYDITIGNGSVTAPSSFDGKASGTLTAAGNPAPVAEPATAALLLVGLAVPGIRRLRRSKA